MGWKWLYMHGLASGPQSKKGVALAEHFASRGVHLERLDGRKPSLERLRLSAILEEMTRALGASGDPAVVFGSSLGGLAAARLAELDDRVRAVVMLAPGLRIADQLRRGLGEASFEKWRSTGWYETHDYATGATSRIDFGFYEDAAAVDARGGGWPEVKVPTLVIHGRNDQTCDVRVSRQWAKGRANVELLEVDDGHELIDSIPVIARESERFLTEIGAAGV